MLQKVRIRDHYLPKVENMIENWITLKFHNDNSGSLQWNSRPSFHQAKFDKIHKTAQNCLAQLQDLEEEEEELGIEYSTFEETEYGLGAEYGLEDDDPAGVFDPVEGASFNFFYPRCGSSAGILQVRSRGNDYFRLLFPRRVLISTDFA
jgi:hypothetical protein